MRERNISRTLERRFILIVAIWQILNGLITIFIYAPYHRREGLDLIDYSVTIIEAEAISQIFGSIYMFIAIFGKIYIIIGIWLIYLSSKMIDNKVLYLIPSVLLIMGLTAYFAMDIISVIFCLLAGCLSLSKNKAIKELHVQRLIK